MIFSYIVGTFLSRESSTPVVCCHKNYKQTRPDGLCGYLAFTLFPSRLLVSVLIIDRAQRDSFPRFISIHHGIPLSRIIPPLSFLLVITKSPVSVSLTPVCIHPSIYPSVQHHSIYYLPFLTATSQSTSIQSEEKYIYIYTKITSSHTHHPFPQGKHPSSSFCSRQSQGQHHQKHMDLVFGMTVLAV